MTASGDPDCGTTGQGVTYLYELMDSACDAKQIHENSERTGHVAIIDTNPRRDTALKEALRREEKAQHAISCRMQAVRYDERLNVERVNAA